jgi:DNA-directed RNA polymerase specialized sigma24 family protein
MRGYGKATRMSILEQSAKVAAFKGFLMIVPSADPSAMSQLQSDSRHRTDAAERALLALVATGDRRAMDQLYILYFARLAKFFQNMTLRADVVEELINDTILEVWKAGESIHTNASVLLAIMKLAYSRVQQYFAEVRADEPHSHRDVHDWEQSNSKLAKSAPADCQIFLFKLPVEERAVAYLVYSSGCSRRETADVMEIACDYVDVLLRAVRASAARHYSESSRSQPT